MNEEKSELVLDKHNISMVVFEIWILTFCIALNYLQIARVLKRQENKLQNFHHFRESLPRSVDQLFPVYFKITKQKAKSKRLSAVDQKYSKWLMDGELKQAGVFVIQMRSRRFIPKSGSRIDSHLFLLSLPLDCYKVCWHYSYD